MLEKVTDLFTKGVWRAGVWKLREFNIAHLEKWCWRMLLDKGWLWYRVLKARYMEVGGRLQEGGV